MMWLLLLCTVLIAPGWVQQESIDGGFAIMVPEPLEISVKSIETEVGSIEYYRHSLSTDHDSLGYAYFSVSYCDYPEGSFPKDSTALVAEFLQVTMEQGAETLEGTLIYSDDISMGEYDGRFWRIHYNGESSVMKTRAYLVEDRFYLIQVAVQATHAQKDFLDRFLESFKLI